MPSASERKKVLSIFMNARGDLKPEVKTLIKSMRVLKRIGIETFRGIKRVAGTVLKPLRLMLGPIGLLTTALSAGAVLKFAGDMANAADVADKFSERLGVGVEELQEYIGVGELLGVQQNQLTIGWQRMTRRIAEAAQGTGEAQGAIRELGLDARELSQLPVDQQFEQIADAMSRVEDQGQRVRLAFKLFDSEGVGLLQILQKGGDELRAMREDLRELGFVMDEDAVKAAVRYKDSVTRLRFALVGLRNTALAPLIPILTELATDAADFLRDNRDDVDRWAKATARAAGVTSIRLKAAFVLFRELAGDPEAAELFGKVMEEAAEIGIVSFKETLIAGLRVGGNVIQIIGRPLLFGAQILGAEIAEEIRDSILNPFRETPAEALARLKDAERQLVAQLEQGFDPRDTIGRESTAFLLEQVRDDIERVEREIETGMEPVLRDLGERWTDTLDGMRHDLGQVDEAVETAAINIRGQVEQSRDEISAFAEETGSGTEAWDRFVASVAGAGATYDDWLADQRAINRELEGTMSAGRGAGQSIAQLNTELANTRQQIDPEKVAELRRELQALQHELRFGLAESQISLLPDREQRAALVDLEFERSLARIGELSDRSLEALEKQHEAGIISETEYVSRRQALHERFNQWIRNAERRRDLDRLVIMGDFFDGAAIATSEFIDFLRDDAGRGQDAMRELFGTVAGETDQLFDAIFEGTKSAGDAFEDLGRQVIKVMAKIAAQELTLGILKSVFNVTPSAKGNIFAGGESVEFFGRGGVIERPTLFPTKTGLGVAGEAGDEVAFAPLTRDSRGNMAVKAVGSGDGPPANVSITIIANDAKGFDRLLQERERTLIQIVQKAIAQRSDLRASIRSAS